MTAPLAYRPELDTLGPHVSLTMSPKEPKAGDTVTLTATVTNNCEFTLRRTVLYVGQPAVAGPARAFTLGSLRPGAAATRNHQVTLPANAEGDVRFTAHAIFDVTASTSDSAGASTGLTLPFLSLRGAFSNKGIADDANVGAADIDGSGSSLSAQALASVGCTPGATVTHDGVAFTWPDTKPGEKDNAVASGQTVLLTGSGGRLAFLGTSTWGEGKGNGKIIYADGTEESFAVAVSDWYGTSPDAAIVAPYRNVASGRNDVPVSLFVFAAPLQEGKELRAVVLPDVSAGVQSGVPALHIFAMTVA